MSNVPYIKNRGETWSSLNFPVCHNQLDYFHSESYFNEKKCRFCGCELAKSDYQIAYELQCDLIEKNEGLKINRIWSMSNKNTFSIKPIRELLERYLKYGEIIIDPFANDSKMGTITNDLCPDYDTDYHMDALDFLKIFDNESIDVVLYDPPYSLRQVTECYKGIGKTITKEDTQSSWRAKHLDEISRILKTNGIAICFGWNTSGVGKKRNMELIEVLIVPHGGSKNDTLVTVEKKNSKKS